MGYFNALEHMMIRVLKALEIALPSGSASHQMILNEFQHALDQLNISFYDFNAFKRLMGFRHIATKIYGFLINEDKLNEIVAIIQANHKAFDDLFQKVIQQATPH